MENLFAWIVFKYGVEYCAAFDRFAGLEHSSLSQERENSAKLLQVIKLSTDHSSLLHKRENNAKLLGVFDHTYKTEHRTL